MTGVVVLLAFGGVLAASLVFAFTLAARQVRRAEEHLRQLAERLRLEVHENPKQLGFRQVPELRGIRRGKRLRVYAYSTGSGNSRTHWTAVAASPAQPSPLVFKLSLQGLGSKLLTLFGVREIQVGDPNFDQRWFIQTNAPDFFRAALLPELRAKLDGIAAQGGKGSYETVDGGVRYAEQGWFTDRARCERFVAVVDATCDLADVAEVYAAQPESR